VEVELEIRKGVALKNYTSWRVGGEAEFFCEVHSAKELVCAITSYCGKDKKKKEKKFKKVTVLGSGSNVLISDKGIKGLTIINKAKAIYEDSQEENLLIAESGVNLAVLYKAALNKKHCDLSALAAIPATVGGAVVSNAGAYGDEISKHIEWIEVLSGNKLKVLKPTECGFGYRKSNFLTFLHNDTILRVAFKKEEFCATKAEIKRKGYLEYRNRTQPKGYSAGSTFKAVSNLNALNPAAIYIDKAGLKGYTIGGAVVSQLHANFILNLRDATASDIKDLINYIKATVKEKFSVMLTEEVQYLGLW